jgi:cyclic beta-1,2-glucan synthetase
MPSPLDCLREQEALLRHAYQYFARASDADLTLSYAAEWMLDNFYVVQQALRQIREDMPAGYYHRLPKLDTSPLEGYPRIYALAREIIKYCESYLDLDRVTRFVQAYQRVTPLTTGELWALPTMLRLGILDNLTKAIAGITGLPFDGLGTPQAQGGEGVSIAAPSSQGRRPEPDFGEPLGLRLRRAQSGRSGRRLGRAVEGLADEAVVANCILSLRTLAAQDWKAFFENVSRVEEVLRFDPANIYARMDFDSRDRYRGVIEELALVTGRDEEEVAREAIRLAEGAQRTSASLRTELRPRGSVEPSRQDSPRTTHVGFYLVDAGRVQLEALLGYRPPLDVRLRRWLLGHPTLAYLGGIALLTLVILLGLICYALVAGGTPVQLIGVGLLTVLPATTVAISLINWLVTHTVPPRTLPRLDFQEGIPAECRTMVVIPGLVSRKSDIEFLVQQMERHYLGNADPHLHFALLTDFADAPEKHMPEDEALLEHARHSIEALNEKYSQASYRPFYLFHRHRQWNPSEDCWMAWERKRGKLVEFNQLLGGSEETSYNVQVGDLDILPEIKYVITLDADTTLPRDSARRLIATLAHPLNRAEFDPNTGKVIAGYTILQPRMQIKPVVANRSLFTRVFSGDTGLDMYTRAVSDVYQDLFGEGIYAGKGIYDVAAFERSLAGRVPENALLSHDLFEGIHGRAGLVTDVILFEDYPTHYLAYMGRLHRWVRGDWQLLPWLLPKVPHTSGGKISNELSVLDRWKILDNLRRSLLAPALLALLIAGWLWLPGSALVWTLTGLLALAMPIFAGLSTMLKRGLRGASLIAAVQSVWISAIRWLLALVFLLYETLIMIDAIGCTLVRLIITHKRLLQWTTAAHTIRLFSRESKIGTLWRQMGAAPLLALVLACLVILINPVAMLVAAPLLLLWLISPQIAHLISRPILHESVPLSADQRQQLRRLARRTWLYFEHFVGPDDHWLPPDHFQEDPRGLVAHRTSPTNIGLLLLSTLAAYDLGYIGPLELALRLRYTFESMDKLERYRGHFLNWYDTRNLKPLPPRYISTVDSGNLAGCLLALKQGLATLPHEPILRWQGLLDTLGVLAEIVEGLKRCPEPTEGGIDIETAVAPLEAHLTHIRQQVLAVQDDPADWAPLLTKLRDDGWQELDRLLISLVESCSSVLDAAALRDLRIWSERVHHHLFSAQSELDLLLPWLRPLSQPPVLFIRPETDSAITDAWQALQDALPAAPRLEEVPEVCNAGRARLDQLQSQLAEGTGPTDQAWPEPSGQASDRGLGERVQEARAWCARLAEGLDSAQMAAEKLLNDYQDLSAQAEAYFRAMDFGFLFDSQRQMFHLGYNVATEKLDSNHYDLLASESRIASLLAIAKGDVPQSHWLHLARPLVRVNGTRALLSWNGSMFEYLMPSLLMRSYEGTLVYQTCQAVIRRQIAYGRQKDVPWGISEAGYYGFDANMNYRYRGFGVPGLGFKRGLDEDLVISPYASLLALPLYPQAVMQNIADLIERQMLGHYGFYEAIDYTPSRLYLGQKSAIVRSYMVHHQGMILLALVNYLQDEAMIRRFHAEPRVQSVELLLQEQVPQQAPVELPHPAEVDVLPPVQLRPALEPWHAPVDAPLPQVHFLSNGRYGLLITSAGGGYSRYALSLSKGWQEIDLTRWRADTTLDNWGTWIYVQDRDSGDLWSVGYQPTASQPESQEVLFYPHKAEFRRRDHDISLRMDITVAPGDDVEIRRITLTNHSDRTRRLMLTSYGEVVLAPQMVDRRHPAFNKLFIESEYLPEVNGLLFRRRSRSVEEEPIYLAHLLVVGEGSKVTGAHESDRARFLGRGGTVRSPAALGFGQETFTQQSCGLSGTTGATLDPIMALGQEINLKPHATAQIAYVTLAAGSRQEALALARRYQAFPAINRAFDQARSHSELELRQLGLTTPDVEHIQQLLSVLLYPHAALRADPETLAANSKGQSGLWPYAISGDYPILLVRIGSQEETALVRELLRAHAYWRNRQIKIDLVVLNQRDIGYAQELHDQLYRLITRTGNDAWLNRRGGIFLLRASQMSDADQVLLETAARAILDGEKGLLAEQLRSLRERPTCLPRFVRTLHGPEDAEPTPPLVRPADLVFDNGLGGFSADGHEYVIYLEPSWWTPAPWINVIANPHFGFLVSEAGAGYTWAENSGENRLTSWRNDPVTDAPGEALYLRDEETGQVWSPTPLPAGAPAPYLIRHGAGYSIFEHNSHGLKQRLRLFAVPDAPVKVVQLRLENTWNRNRRITATFFAEWVLGTTRDTTQQYVIPEFDARSLALLARNPYNEEFGERVAFLAATREPHGLTADRTEFLGRMGSLSHPAALDRVGLTGAVEAGPDPCAAMQILLWLAPGEVKEVTFLLGQGANRQEALRLVERFQNIAQIEAAWEALTDFWDGLLGVVTVQTPDPAMNLLLNRWLLYQALSCRVWGRSALYQSSGAFGFRDQLQDVMALVHAAPDVVRDHILRAARHQFESGDVLHWWHSPSGRGVRTRCSDDLLWLPFVTAHYVNTTGDESILTEKVPFLKDDTLEREEVEHYGHYEIIAEVHTLYEHCCRALDRGTTAGPHGLPLIGSGDWNDGLNRVGIEGRGESIWLGWFLHATLTCFAAICELVGDGKQANRYRQQARDLRQALEANAWDGNWYLRAYYDDGMPLGSVENRECQIASIAQSWAVLSGAADPARAAQAMDAVADRLVRHNDQLVLLFTPPFDKTTHDPGYIKGYPPGIRENGGQYTHAALWTVWAFAEMGQGDRAGGLFRLLNPIYHSDTPEKVMRYRVEPYVVAADVYSVPPHTGRGGWTWYTGAASWMYRLGLEAILGLRRVGKALQIRPCIPRDWPSYELTYRNGETFYWIRVENPDGVNRGVKQVTLDGKVLSGGDIPLLDDGRQHKVHVLMG